MPACSAASRCSTRSDVKTGMSTRRPATTPAWRAAIVQPPWIACGARPASAVSVSAESTSARPAPTRICEGKVATMSALGSRPEPCEAAADEDRPGGRPGPRVLDPPRERAGRERRERHDRHREGRDDRRVAPPVDQQQDDQEEGRRDRRRHQTERHVRCQVRPARGAHLARDRPGTRLAKREASHRCRDDRGDRHLHEEDRLPGHELRQHAADGRPDRGANRPRRRPHRHSAPLGSDARRKQLERPRHGRRAAEGLNAAGGDQRRDARREPAGEAAAREDREARGHRPRRPDAPRRQRRGHGSRGEDDVEGDENPGDRADRDVEVAVDLGQRQHHDRAVGQDEADGYRRARPLAGSGRRETARLLGAAGRHRPRCRSGRRLRRGAPPSTIRYSSRIGRPANQHSRISRVPAA